MELTRKDGSVMETKISPCDVGKVTDYPRRWTAMYESCVKNFYVQSDVRLGRFLLNPTPDMVVDHINGDTLDNRRENLRIATKSENQRNRRISGKTGVRGVGFTKWEGPNGKYTVQFRIGSYDTIEEASEVAARARQILEAEFPHMIVARDNLK